eukprot:7103025-Pyramimonas_sp.AAC.1
MHHAANTTWLARHSLHHTAYTALLVLHSSFRTASTSTVQSFRRGVLAGKHWTCCASSVVLRSGCEKRRYNPLAQKSNEKKR